MIEYRDFTCLGDSFRRDVVATLSARLATDVDAAIRAALAERGLTPDEALPRMFQQVYGERRVILLDGRPLVTIHPLEVADRAGHIGESVRVERHR